MNKEQVRKSKELGDKIKMSNKMDKLYIKKGHFEKFDFSKYFKKNPSEATLDVSDGCGILDIEKLEKLAEKFTRGRMVQDMIDYDFNPNTATCTSASPSAFSTEEFEKAMQTLKDMPPIVVEIEVYKSIWYKIKECILETDTNLLGHTGPSRINVKVVAILGSYDFNENQVRLIYNNGTSKIVNLFKER